MQRIYVDFGKGVQGEIDINFTGEGALRTIVLAEGEHVILYDSSLEVEAVAHETQTEGRPYWYAVPDWATQQQYDVSSQHTA